MTNGPVVEIYSKNVRNFIEILPILKKPTQFLKYYLIIFVVCSSLTKLYNYTNKTGKKLTSELKVN